MKRRGFLRSLLAAPIAVAAPKIPEAPTEPEVEEEPTPRLFFGGEEVPYIGGDALRQTTTFPHNYGIGYEALQINHRGTT